MSKSNSNFIAGYRAATQCGASMAAIQELAEDFASAVKLKPGANLEPLVEALGGRIKYQSFSELETTRDESIRVDGPRDFTITLPNYTSPERDRFTIAHELGHFLLHYPIDTKPTPMKAARFGSSRVEWEANWFAAGLLMPKPEFKNVYKRAGGDIETVAQHFGVSTAAAKVRREVLLPNV